MHARDSEPIVRGWHTRPWSWPMAPHATCMGSWHAVSEPYACPLKVVIETGLKTIAKNTYPGLETVVFCGFTPQEQAELSDFANSVA